MPLFWLPSHAEAGSPRRGSTFAATLGIVFAAALPGMADEESSPGVEVVARGVAVKDACAWPNLTALPDGTVIATIFNQPCHGNWEGDVECHATTDGGATWRLRGTPAPHEPGTNRMNVAVGRAASGDVIEIRPGLFGVCLYGWDARTTMDHSHFFTSADDGRTWRLASSISRDTNETAPLRLPGGDLLACGRRVKDQHLELSRSTDAGATWTWELGLSRAMQHPAHLRLLADGRLLTAYYAKATPRHDGYQMATVVWRLPPRGPAANSGR